MEEQFPNPDLPKAQQKQKNNINETKLQKKEFP